MDDIQKTAVKSYAKKYNSNVVDGDVLDLVVDEVADRVLLYLNTNIVGDNLLRIIARVVVGVYNQTNTNVSSVAPEQAVESIKDQGQSITYASRAKDYLGSASDSELFGGFTELLAPYRRLSVITTVDDSSIL